MKQLVFLVGCQRSGTTWLQKVLGGHPQIGTAQESHVFDQFIGPAMRFWDRVVGTDVGRGGVGLPAYLTRGEFDSLGREMVERVAGSGGYVGGKIELAPETQQVLEQAVEEARRLGHH